MPTLRPTLRLYAVPTDSLREIPLDRPSRSHLQLGEKLVWWVDAASLATCPQKMLVHVFIAALKRLRAENPAWPVPAKKDIEAWCLKRDGHTYDKIAARLWPKHADGLRQAKRAVKNIQQYLRTPAGRMFEKQGFLAKSAQV